MMRWLWWLGFLSVFALGRGAAALAEETPAPPERRNDVTLAAAVDERVAALMGKYEIPAGAVAITKNDRLIHAAGYGFADRERTTPVTPATLFRIASLSKPITCIAVLRLADAGQLSLDDPAFDHLPRYQLSEIADLDERIRGVTIRQLLEHSAGWDRDATFDPMFRAAEIAAELGEPAPATPDMVIRYMLRRKLDFEPGAKSVYSNFGYCLLGRVIENVTGKPYEQAVQELVLTPAGIQRMRLGKSRLAERAPGEVFYDDETAGETTPSVFPIDTEPVSWCYGGFHLEAMDAHGGWLASPIDLARFVTAIDGRRGQALLSQTMLREMTARPSHAGDDAYVGLCWNLRPAGDGVNWWHTGSLPGTSALLVRTHHGYAWAAVFNDRPAGNRKRNAFHAELDALFWEALEAAGAPPHEDLFTRFP